MFTKKQRKSSRFYNEVIKPRLKSFDSSKMTKGFIPKDYATDNRFQRLQLPKKIG